MCGRYTLSSPIEVVAELFELAGTPPPLLPVITPRFNLAPTQWAPVALVREPGAGRTLELLRWGLIPFWAKEAGIGNKLINARAESAAEKPAFRSSFKKKRCLIPTDGFFEWKKEGKLKQPYLIRRRDHHPFAFAGLWSSWKNPQGELLDTFTILTTDPNADVRALHDRMPVILGPGDFALWLDPKFDDAARLQALLVPAAAGDLEALPVSRAVNSPAHDSPDCIQPLAT